MVKEKIKLGFIFKDKYKKDPSGLTLETINKIVFGERSPKVVSINTPIVSSRGNVFDVKDYNIDAEFDKLSRK